MGGVFSHDRAGEGAVNETDRSSFGSGPGSRLSDENRIGAGRSLNRKRRRPRRAPVVAFDGDTTTDESDLDTVDLSSNEDDSPASSHNLTSSPSSVHANSGNQQAHSGSNGGQINVAGSGGRAPHTKRLKLDSTAQYIYEKLFIQGEGSDVTIKCLGREWKLHKLYLSQSNYFECMFGGRWLESEQNSISIDIPDSFVTESALNIAFGSLYCGEVNIPTGEVVAVLSAASLFQLDGMVDLCIKIMHHNINLCTVGLYYNAAQLYGHPRLARKCARWLQRVLMFTQSLDLLQSISIDLMVTIINSSNFFVNQVEMDIYTLLKKWVFLRLNPSWSGQRRELLDAKDAFFVNHCSGRLSFLETDLGQPFVPAFKGLRLQYISADRASLLKVEQDNIIPKQWLRDICWLQWKTMLESEHASLSSSQAAASSNATQNNANSQLSGSNGNGASLSAPMTSHGMINATNSSSNQTLHSSSINTSSSGSRGLNPLLSNHFSHQNTNSSNNGISGGNGSTTKHCNAPSVAPAIFNRYSMRCGRILDIPNNDYCWRWTGFNYGVDLLMLFSNNQLMIKRNVNTHPTTQSLSMQEKREIMLRVSALSFDENYNAVYFKTSGIVSKELGKDEELLIMDIDRYAICPIYLSFNVLTTVPDISLYQQLCKSLTMNSVTNTPAVVGSANEDNNSSNPLDLDEDSSAAVTSTAPSNTINNVAETQNQTSDASDVVN